MAAKSSYETFPTLNQKPCERKISQEDNLWPLSMKVNNIHNHRMVIIKVILSVWTPNHGGSAGARTIKATNAATRWDILKLQNELRKEYSQTALKK
jgi:hypothetical protein